MSEQNSKSLYSALWASADILRSKMDANEYKNYLLGIIFYKEALIYSFSKYAIISELDLITDLP